MLPLDTRYLRILFNSSKILEKFSFILFEEIVSPDEIVWGADKLSEKLHEELTKSFVDKRISVLSKGLKQDIELDTKIVEQDKIMKKELEEGIVPDPNAPVDPQTGMPMDPSMDLGQPIMEPDLESDAKAVQAPEGGEIW